MKLKMNKSISIALSFHLELRQKFDASCDQHGETFSSVNSENLSSTQVKKRSSSRLGVVSKVKFDV